MPAKQRLDRLLVERGLIDSREKAQALIMAGRVCVEGVSRLKAGELVLARANIKVKFPPHPFVSRGGQKLATALSHFNLDPKGITALDIGASTGGFTHCLLLNGATKVIALDVGYGQLAWELRKHPSVEVMENVNIRHLPAGSLPLMDWLVVDVSFISLKIVLRSAACFLKSGGTVIALVKPQFEAGIRNVKKGGKVDSNEIHEEVLKEILHCGKNLGWQSLGITPSPITGKKSGNKEFLAAWHSPKN